MKIELLTNRTGYHRDLKEVQDQWIGEILNFLGLPTEIFEAPGVERLQLLEYLAQNHIDIIEYSGLDALQIRCEGEIVGEWTDPEFLLCTDQDGQSYYKISIETWSILEEDIELNSDS